jgi:hypothetical protein
MCTDVENPQYSLASLFSLAHYSRVLSFPPPGLILNSAPLDSIIAFSDPGTISSYPLLNSTDASLSSLILVKPSTQTFESLKRVHSSTSMQDKDLLSSFFPSKSPLLEDVEDTKLYTTAATLRKQENFDSSVFMSETAFVMLQDPDLPGPEYDVPYTDIVKMRPKNEDQGFLWEKMYSTYKDRRYGVCGLDLEAWPPSKDNADDGRKEDTKIGKTDL